MANDSFIWDKLKIGDKQSFELIFKIYYPQLCLFANRYTRDFDMAREVVQEIFIYLWENRDNLQEKKSVKSYLYAAIRHNSVRRVNGQIKKRLEIEDIPEENIKADFLDEIEYAELQEIIYTTIESFPPQCKKIFSLSRFESATYAQIALKLNLSQKTVEAQMTKALKIIQKKFDEYLLVLSVLFFI